MSTFAIKVWLGIGARIRVMEEQWLQAFEAKLDSIRVVVVVDLLVLYMYTGFRTT